MIFHIGKQNYKDGIKSVPFLKNTTPSETILNTTLFSKTAPRSPRHPRRKAPGTPSGPGSSRRERAACPPPSTASRRGDPSQASFPACPLPTGHIGSSASLDPGRPARRGPGLLCQSSVPVRAIRAEKSMAALGEKAGSFHALENR